jgi:predicted phosphodiesterase
VRIRLLSDLHLEQGPWASPDVDQDVVVLAGDIHKAMAGIAWAGQHFSCPVIYVPGNHEYDFADMLTLGEQFGCF